MIVISLLEELRLKGIKIDNDGDKLLIKGNKNKLTKDLIDQLKENKNKILDAIKLTKQQQLFHDRVIYPTPCCEDIPLSFAQESIWLHEQLEPNSKNYNVPFVRLIEGKINVDYLKKAFEIIIERHSILRTIFYLDNSEVKQKIENKMEFSIQTEKINAGINDVNLRSRINDEISMLFDLTHGPLFRALILYLDANKAVFCITLHHIITDAWSFGLMLKELTTYYNSFISGQSVQLPMPLIQYKDYAFWQREWIKHNGHEEQLIFWQHQLKDIPYQLNLSPNLISNQDRAGGICSFAINSDIRQMLIDTTARLNITPFALLLANYQLLLYRCTQQNKFITGVAIANRRYAEMESLFGFMVNMLPIVADINLDLLVSEFIQQVQSDNLSALENQDIPFDILLNSLQVERKPGIPPLVQAVFSFQNAAEINLKFTDIKSTIINFDLQIAKRYLILSIEDDGKQFVGAFEYAKSVFTEECIDKITREFNAQLQYLLQNINCSLRATPLTMINIAGATVSSSDAMVNEVILSDRPMSVIEQKIADIWQEVLNIKNLQAGANFFRLGGNSIGMIKVMTKAREQGIHFSVRQFLKNQTVAALAKVITDGQ